MCVGWMLGLGVMLARCVTSVILSLPPNLPPTPSLPQGQGQGYLGKEKGCYIAEEKGSMI